MRGMGVFDPFCHISCLAEGGLGCIICYTGQLFRPSANWLPWRKGSGSQLDLAAMRIKLRIYRDTLPPFLTCQWTILEAWSRMAQFGGCHRPKTVGCQDSRNHPAVPAEGLPRGSSSQETVHVPTFT